MNQVEFLLRLSENARETGDDIARRHYDERAAHVKELQALWSMIEMARNNVWTELSRFGALNENKQAEVDTRTGQIAGSGGLSSAQVPQQGRIPRVVAANQATKERQP